MSENQRPEITTRYGSPCEIIWADKETGVVNVRRLEDGQELHTYIYELRAPGGFREIVQVIDSLPASPATTGQTTELVTT